MQIKCIYIYDKINRDKRAHKFHTDCKLYNLDFYSIAFVYSTYLSLLELQFLIYSIIYVIKYISQL